VPNRRKERHFTALGQDFSWFHACPSDESVILDASVAMLDDVGFSKTAIDLEQCATQIRSDEKT
jgi:hypothetical protein